MPKARSIYVTRIKNHCQLKYLAYFFKKTLPCRHKFRSSKFYKRCNKVMLTIVNYHINQRTRLFPSQHVQKKNPMFPFNAPHKNRAVFAVLDSKKGDGKKPLNFAIQQPPLVTDQSHRIIQTKPKHCRRENCAKTTKQLLCDKKE